MHIADPITVTMKTQCIDWRRPSSCASSFELFPDGQLPPIPLRLPTATGTSIFPSGFMGPSHIDCPVTVRCNYQTACMGNRPHILMAYKVGILTWPQRLAASYPWPVCNMHVRFFVTLWTIGGQVPLSIGFSRQEYWSGLLCFLPGYLPDPGIELASLILSASAGGVL